MNKFIDKYNTTYGLLTTLCLAIFGTYWYLFAGYLFFNILDWLTGWYKARYMRRESSLIGARGILKKLGYWIIILVAFLVPKMFISLGRDMLGINLDFLFLFGWFTLAALMINEIRSILENLVECGYEVPEFLVKGLAVTQKLIEAGASRGESK